MTLLAQLPRWRLSLASRRRSRCRRGVPQRPAENKVKGIGASVANRQKARRDGPTPPPLPLNEYRVHIPQSHWMDGLHSVGLEPMTFQAGRDQARFPHCATHTTVLTCLLVMQCDYTYMNNEEGRARAEKKRTIGVRTATFTTRLYHPLTHWTTAGAQIFISKLSI